MKNTTRKTTFTELLRKWETIAFDYDNPEREKTLYNLATACVYSVLNKVIRASGDKTVESIKWQTVHSVNYLETVRYAVENATELQFNENGDPVSVVINPELQKNIQKLLSQNLEDGQDLINDAVVAILEETEKATDRSVGFMERPYLVRRLKKQVHIKTPESVGAWETVEMSPVRTVYRSLMTSIRSSSAVQVASHKYTYIEDLARDPESETETPYYLRLPMYSNLVGEVTDINGKIIAQTANSYDVKQVQTLISLLNLSDRQMQVLTYRLKGYGKKAIGTALGIQPRLVDRTLKQIQVKCFDMGIAPKNFERPTVK